MITNIKTISSQAVAVLLWRHLGDLRVWPDFLADNIRNRQDVNGYTLMPCARTLDGRTKSPMYDLLEVAQFIRDVQACVPGTKPGKMTVTTLAIDDALPWRHNTFSRAGISVRKRSVFVGAGAGVSKPKPHCSRRSGGYFPLHMH